MCLRKRTTVKIKKGKDFDKKNDLKTEITNKLESKKKIKCFESSRYSPLRNECPNLKRNKGKALNVN